MYLHQFHALHDVAVCLIANDGEHRNMILYDRKKRDTPLIRTYGTACERMQRMVLQVTVVGMLMLAALFLALQGSVVSMISDEVPRTIAPHHENRPLRYHVRHTAEPATTKGETPVGDANDRPAVISADETIGGSECPGDVREVYAAIMTRVGNPKPETFLSADHTRFHFDKMMERLKSEPFRTCARQQRSHLAAHKKENGPAFFFDLGSRTLDQTKIFIRSFPNAQHFHIVCFEANPKFNGLYPEFQAQHPQQKLTYFNLAVGVENATLILSDENVGSSIVREKHSAAARSRSPNDSEVRVVDFTPLFVDLVTDGSGDIPEATPHVVVKMDIEKVEFAALHRMIDTGAILLVDELLLECHYNTNLSRERRDLTKHLGIDDCQELVAQLNDAFRVSSSDSSFEVVLWNSKKTAKSSGYSARHGGFYPT